MPEEPDRKDNEKTSSETLVTDDTTKKSSQDALLQALSEVEKEPRPTLVAGTERHFKISNPRPDSIQPSSNKKKLIIISLAVIILLVSAGAGTAFALWYTNPDKAVSDAVVNVAAARTTIADGSYEYTDSKNKGNINLTFNSKADTPHFKGQLDASLKVNYDKYKFDLAGSGLLSEKGNVYFKFDGVKKILDSYIDEPDIENYTEITPELKNNLRAFAAKIDGQWIKLDQAAVKTIWASFNHAKTKTCFAKVYDDFGKNPSQRSEITNIYDQNRFIIIKNKGNQAVNGVDSVKYDVTANVANYYKASDAFEKTAFGQGLQKCTEQLSGEKQADKDKVSDKKYRDDNIQNEQKDIDKSKLTVWVSRWGHEFTKSSFVRSDTKAKTHTSLNINYKINQKINAKEPAKSIPLKEFQADLDKIQTSLYGSSPTQAASATNEDNAATIASRAELFAADKNGRYPTVEELKAATGAAALSPELKVVIHSAAPDATNPDRIQYKPCGKQYEVYYWDPASGKSVASHAAPGCREQVS